MKRYRPFILLSLITLAACKKNISNPVSDLPPSTFSQAFDEFWNELNVNYVYWDVDTTNWDAMYQRYKPLFDSLKIDDTADLSKSVGYFRQMTDGLIDHHFSIAFTNNVLKDSSVIPSYDQWRKDPAFRFPYSYIGTDERYLDSGYRMGNNLLPGSGNYVLAVSGTIHGNILFFTCNQFQLSASFGSVAGNGVQLVLNYFFQRLENPTGLKAVVLDFRDNPGGDVNDLNFLAGHFIDQSLHFGYTRNKSGNGRLDYTPWIDAAVVPQSGAQAVTLPVIILADKYSQSMAEIMTMALRTLPQCRVVGETTFGATGPFAANALYDDGSFSLPGFLSVTTSSVEFKYIDGKMYEGKGFPPDYPVAFNVKALDTLDDPQMDKALSLVQ
ncbi:S41 family peptidase [Dinghuibacter silviterrae]|uniref:Tricorn protease-like protein n=1 Tax=Dinghuibacter silviterrae TaxID=1539049 RepID=A0A4R8DG00_9BACT|nr:S41 family peptidase [Dinghuibacter silviterrae]TDW96539.1 tricorn protease-like protein [Dinghuibacter silviterrae]